VELMTVNFSLLALDQIMNTAATIRHMSGGQFGVPLVIRMATGAGKQLAAQHSHSLEGWYAHIPGLKGAGTRHGGGCARHALDRAAGPRPGADLRERHALQPDGADRREARAPSTSPAAMRREGTDMSA
jgi:2-oxoisovalerate dehydrogenase E1 component